MNIEVKKRSPYGTAALTLGIMSIVFFIYPYMSISCGILGIVLGNKGVKMVYSKLASAGKVTGIVGIISTSLVLLYSIVGFLQQLFF